MNYGLLVIGYNMYDFIFTLHVRRLEICRSSTKLYRLFDHHSQLLIDMQLIYILCLFNESQLSNVLILTETSSVSLILANVGWPRLLLQVYREDRYGRRDLCGYGMVTVPSRPGHHSLTCHTWRPVGACVHYTRLIYKA